MDSRANKTRARVEITRRVSPFLAWGDFHARSRFARSTIPEKGRRKKRHEDSEPPLPLPDFRITNTKQAYTKTFERLI